MWVKLDDGFTDHPKIDGLSDAAFRLHVSAMVYCGKNLTDGFVPMARVHRLTPNHCDDAVFEVLDAGLWHEVDGGYDLHDFLDYNPTAAEVKAQREARAAAGRKGGKQSGRSRREASAEANASANAQAKSKPAGSTPTRPDPTRTRDASTSVGVLTPTASTPTPSAPRQNGDSPEFVEFWTCYPRKVGKGQARAAWRKAVKGADADTIVAGARRYAAAVEAAGTETQFVAHPTTWLNGERWADESLPQAAARPLTRMEQNRQTLLEALNTPVVPFRERMAALADEPLALGDGA